MRSKERPIASVPVTVSMALLMGFGAQVLWHLHRPPPEAIAAALPEPPPHSQLHLVAAGDPIALSKALMLWLQAFDNQPGISIPFRNLEYGRVIDWLEHILRLDEQTSYPLLAAARLYGEVPVPEKQRQMLDFVHR
jgi:hypothetical protein